MLSVSSTNNTDLHDITELLLKMALNIITLTSCYNSRYVVLPRFDFDVIHFSQFFLGFVSLSTGKMVLVLSRAMKRITENLSMLFL